MNNALKSNPFNIYMIICYLCIDSTCSSMYLMLYTILRMMI